MEIHESITESRLVEAMQSAMTDLDSPGICTSCGEDAFGVEPDAEGHECEVCGESKVYGVEQLAMMMLN